MTGKPAVASALFGAALTAAIVGCSRRAEPAEAAAQTSATNVIKLDTAQRARIHLEKVEPVAFNALITTTGVVAFDGNRSTQVIAPVSGPVTRILVAPGDRVERGQPLAMVSSPDFAQAVASYRKAESASQNAQRIATLDEQLFKNDALARSELDQARTDLAAATEDRDAALSELRSLGLDEASIAAMHDGKSAPVTEAAIRAPISGTVVEKLLAPGQLIQAGSTPCFTVADLSTVWVMANVFESDLSAIQRKAAAFITTDAARDTLKGYVEYLADLVDPASKATMVRVVVPNRNRLLKRDMLVRVTIRTLKPRTGILVPVAAVLRDDENLPFVYTAGADGGFARQRIDLGERVGERYVVTSGLKAGDTVASDGALFLDGMAAQ